MGTNQWLSKQKGRWQKHADKNGTRPQAKELPTGLLWSDAVKGAWVGGEGSHLGGEGQGVHGGWLLRHARLRTLGK